MERWMTETARKLYRLSRATWPGKDPVVIVGKSKALTDMLNKLEKVAAFDEPVLVSGESGSGKEHVAEALYLLSKRRGGPFVTVNCPQFQEGNLTVSELFGHRKGSFTGAIADRKGCFEAANGGVLFLDEIGDLHISAQLALLRALATGEYRPLGSEEVRRADVRVIAATNRPLEKLMVDQRFRDDLFFRLRYFHIKVPPLRERNDDWILLIDYFLARLKAVYGVEKRFSDASLKVLASYHWPGNVRELRSVVTMGYAMADGQWIRPQDFITLLEKGDDFGAPESPEEIANKLLEGADFWELVHKPFMQRDLNRSEVREVIRICLLRSGGSYRQMAKKLGLLDQYQKLMDFLRHHRLKP